jgi:hypothetical protein
MRVFVGFLSGIGLASVAGLAFVVLKLVTDPDRRPDRAVGLGFVLSPSLWVAVAIAFGLGAYLALKTSRGH